MNPDEKDTRVARGDEIYEAGLVQKPHLEIFIVDSK